MKTTGAETVFNRSAAEPEIKQLSARNHVMLRPREAPRFSRSHLIG